MSKFLSLSSAFRRSVAVAVVAGSSWAVAGAQTSSPAGPTAASGSFPAPSLFAVADDASMSSSSISSDLPSAADAAGDAASTNLATLEKGVNLPGLNAQYGRRRYGAPRYRGGNTNADGSEKYTVFAGVGFTLPEGTNSNDLKTSYGFQVGGGRNFNKHVGVNLQFDYDKFGFTGQTLNNQAAIYFGDSNAEDNGLDGNSHIWSFTVDPIFYLKQGDAVGVYVTAGGGFYHKTANFFVPQEVEGLEYGIYPVEYVADETIDDYTSNSVGVNGGIGFTYKFSKFANERFYGEVRYVHTFNSYRPESTINADGTVSGYNFFSQNSLSTDYIPVKFGVRF